MTENLEMVCDECGSPYFKRTSPMASLCPECAHRLYDCEPCAHRFEAGRCALCGWNGSVSKFIGGEKIEQKLLFSSADIKRLVDHERICKAEPWKAGDRAVEQFYRGVCEKVSLRCNVLERGEWDHFGSGYASFVGAWFYRDEAGFRVPNANGKGLAYTGLSVLLSRLTDHFAFLEMRKGWDERSGYGGLPDFEGLDRLDTPAVKSLAVEVESVLAEFALKRLFKEDLAGFLPKEVSLETNLSNGPLRQFDALFHWYD